MTLLSLTALSVLGVTVPWLSEVSVAHATPAPAPATPSLAGTWKGNCESSLNGSSYRKEMTLELKQGEKSGIATDTDFHYRDAACRELTGNNSSTASFTFTSEQGTRSVLRMVPLPEEPLKKGATLEARVTFTLSDDGKTLKTKVLSARVMTDLGPADMDPEKVKSLQESRFTRK